VLAIVAAAVGVGTLALLPDELDASGSCLPRELKAKLAQINQKFGRVEIVSTYRGGARMPNGRSSFHASCRAVDFKPPPGRYSQVAGWLKSSHDGGVGTYSCGMHHIHIDNGPRVRFHHCQSAEAGPEMDAEAVKAARAEWPKAGTGAAFPVILPEAQAAGSSPRI
jgi:hypothetical protein